MRDIIASEEDKFWKVLSRNTNFNNDLINLDIRLLKNYYKSLGFYDIKVISNLAEINEKKNVDLIYSIERVIDIELIKFHLMLIQYLIKVYFSFREKFSEYIGEYYSPFKIKSF